MAVSRGVRAAWIIGGSVFATAVLMFGTVQAVAGLAHEERSVRTVVDDPIRVIDIEAAGSVTVIGSDTDVVTIDERVSDGLQHPDRSIRVVGDRLVLRGTCVDFLATFCGDDFVVQAPRAVRVVARGMGISVRRVLGGADLTSDGDSIHVRQSAGAMRLRSHGGDITATAIDATSVETDSFGGDTTLAFASPPRRVDASSHGGHIFVGLPDRAVAYRVDASAAGGSTDTLIRTDPTSPRTIDAESFGGDITIRYTNG